MPLFFRTCPFNRYGSVHIYLAFTKLSTKYAAYFASELNSSWVIFNGAIHWPGIKPANADHCATALTLLP